MTDPARDRLPADGAAIEFSEDLRAACPDHGAYYADLMRADATVDALLRAQAPIEAIVGHDDPAVRTSVGSSLAASQVAMRAATRGNSFNRRLHQMLARNQSGDVNAFADDFSTYYIEELGRRPDLADILKLGLYFTTSIIRVNRAIPNYRPTVNEGSIALQLTNTLLAKSDRSLLCDIYPSPSMEGSMAYAEAISSRFAAAYPEIEPGFLTAVIMSLRTQSVNLMHLEHNVVDHMPDPGLESDRVRERGRDNTQLAHDIRRLRRHGIKPLVFDISDIIPGRDAVYHEFSQLEHSVYGEQPLAVVRIVDQTAAPVDKLRIETRREHVVEGAMDWMRTKLGEIIISLDHNGELYMGMGITANAIPLRLAFEYGGAAGKYEMLRGELLARLFDAVAPARIVELLEAPVTRGPAEAPDDDAPEPPADVVRRLVLRRINYFRPPNTMGAIRKAFDEALRAEDAEQAQQAHRVRDHAVAGFVRRLPVTAKGPSKEAVANAKVAYGQDYELPPGYTFVAEHRRGDLTLGTVLGHIATRRNIADASEQP